MLREQRVRVTFHSHGLDDVLRTMMNGFRIRQVGCQLDRHAHPPGQVDELEELVVFAPAVGLAPKRDVAPFLLPVPHRRKLGPRRWPDIPHVQQDGLARPGAKPRERRNRTTFDADVLAIGHHVVVLGEHFARRRVTIRVRQFVPDGIGAVVDEPTHSQVLLGEPGCSRHIDHRIGMRQKVLGPRRRDADPRLVEVTAPVRPTIRKPESSPRRA